MTALVHLPFTFGDAMRRARIDAHLTVEEIAVALKVSYKTVWSWEHDIHVPAGRRLAAYIELTGAAWLTEAANQLPRRNNCSVTSAGQSVATLAA